MIKLENVILDFPIPQKVKKLENKKNVDQATGGMMGTQTDGKYALRALDNISFTLQPGDKLGLIGHNGAGKTTLLRVMAGLYAPTSGTVTAEGKVTALLNLSFGMDPEATGYENILLRGLYLGMSRAEIKSKTECIADFSELSDFLNLPVRTYSAGMRARLAFAVSMHIDASTVLLDEAIGAGDAAFFQKARQKLDSMVSGATLVFASHSNQTIREICNKGLLLEHGKIKAFGDLDEVLNTYEQRTQMNQCSIANVPSKKGAFAGLSGKDHIKKVLLVNDTGALSNPGCKAVRKAYKLLFERHIHKAEITKSIPVNYWVEDFREIAIPGKETIKREADYFASGVETTGNIDLEKWESIRKNLAVSDQELQLAFSETDLVLLNGEGSIHHNSVRALALLALAKTAIEAGKKVLLMNATIQDIMPDLIKDVIARCELVHVREAASQKYLAQYGVDAIVTADLAFMALQTDTVIKALILDASQYVVVTGGVLSNEDSLNQIFDAVQNAGLRSVYFSVGDGGETELARKLCAKRNVPMVDAFEYAIHKPISFLKQFPLAISGRHHINVFLMRAGVPFVPLPSNTWKIEETLKLVNYPIQPVKTYAEILPTLQEVRENRDKLSQICQDSYLSGKASVDDLIGKIESCV